jgi:SSS family solute:Na+ symporter
VKHALARIPDTQTQGQMQLVIALSLILPVGVKGMVVAAVLMGIFGGDGMHLHSWSSIFIQDVLLPLRKKPISTAQHLKLLRLSVVGVAVFAFCFGALFRQTEYVAFWFIVTMAIYVGGAGACIIGGLYWSRGTTAGAWTALIIGSTLATSGIIIRQFDPNFPLNVIQVGFIAQISASSSYVIVSLLTCRQPHNMDKLLHRGEYAVEPQADGEPVAAALAPIQSGFSLRKVVGIDEHFSRSDRWVAWGIFIWSVCWFLVFVIGSAVYLLHPWSSEAWADYWLWTGIYLPLLIAVGTTIWFTIGCSYDLRLFFRRLSAERIDLQDDGTVKSDDQAANVNEDESASIAEAVGAGMVRAPAEKE